MRVGSARCCAMAIAVCSVTAGLGLRRAHAEPLAPTTLCASYPDIPDCTGKVPACSLCHDSTDPPSWNSFGLEVKGQLSAGVPFATALVPALAAVADDDADMDGVSNLAELQRGSSPSVADRAAPSPMSGLTNPRYRIGDYDPAFAFRRVSTLYCGRSPSYAEMSAFMEGAPDDATLKQRMHAALDRCLSSDYWRNEGLLRLADKRIKPVLAFGKDTDILIFEYRLVVGDYDYDYRLWRYGLSEDHDMRELLTAQFHLVQAADGTLQKVTGLIEKPDEKALAGGQPVPAEHRAGLLTTQWFLAYNTMFSPMPRVSAAQAYRSYLGADIAASEGLRPVAGEPVDVDKRGVAAPRCANCHSTLDPLAYAFAEYDGIALSSTPAFGTYNPGRPSAVIAGWNPSAQKSVLLGKPVSNLVEWGKVASESDEFKRNIADMFFRQALNRAALPDELAEFDALWQSAATDGYSANKMLHRLIDTHAFGSP
ncbi:MAG: hypothetical protein JWN48_817 [Myxococcaceae bacterium]|nr:hypothetical protein [Myxococcaceae bacterium]